MNTTPEQNVDTENKLPQPDLKSTTPWTDADYQLFVEHYATGAYPELQADPCAFDEYFILAADADAPHRPTLISAEDFHAHLPLVYQDSFGLLGLKLWEVARAKGYTAVIEEQYRRALIEQQKRDEELRRQQLRGEIEALRPNLPVPDPKSCVDPRQQWYAAIMAAILPDTSLVEKVKHVQNTVIEGQPFRNALLKESAAAVLNSTFGPLMLAESADAMAEPFEPVTDTDDARTRSQEVGARR